MKTQRSAAEQRQRKNQSKLIKMQVKRKKISVYPYMLSLKKITTKKKKHPYKTPKRIPKCPNCLRLSHLFICFPNTIKLTQSHTHTQPHAYIQSIRSTQKILHKKREEKNIKVLYKKNNNN